ncbi:hypothetical protein LR48_Vigan511s000500 [Vigna angularis]|uniref:Uncharacterized protein n=1 Tax=Phaseolus angularis TaxID=3914 RepID=A0A0L9TCD4_PHAAN|nr:hypothetical protein LR48_Vigan511s000500 [Vigna angularis]
MAPRPPLPPPSQPEPTENTVRLEAVLEAMQLQNAALVPSSGNRSSSTERIRGFRVNIWKERSVIPKGSGELYKLTFGLDSWTFVFGTNCPSVRFCDTSVRSLLADRTSKTLAAAALQQ